MPSLSSGPAYCIAALILLFFIADDVGNLASGNTAAQDSGNLPPPAPRQPPLPAVGHSHQEVGLSDMQRVLTARKGKSLSRREKVNVIARTLQAIAALAVVALMFLSISCGKGAQSEAARRRKKRQAREEARGLFNKGGPRSPMSASNESEFEIEAPSPMLVDQEFMRRRDETAAPRVEQVAVARRLGSTGAAVCADGSPLPAAVLKCEAGLTQRHGGEGVG